MEEFITACPRNCYSACTFRVQVVNNCIKKILPFPGNLATPEGPCIKGLSYIERVFSPDRLIHPFIRSSDGSFNRIKLNEALDIASSRLEDISKKNGSQSILWYRGSGMTGLVNETGSAFWKALGGVTTTYGNLCWPAGLEAVRLTLGSVKHNVPWDLENSSTIILWGKNPASTNIQEISFIAKARNKGCRVIVIDPLRTATADKADMFFSPDVGTDAALALAIAGILVRNEMTDNEFIGRHVSGFEEFKNSLTITPVEAAKITGIPAESISLLADIIAGGSPVTIIPGYGLQRHLNGGQTIRAILSLLVITGNIGKSGAGFNFANLQSYIYDDPKEPVSYYPDKEKDKPFRRIISMARLGRDMLSTKDPELKAAWIERGNPLLQSPDSEIVSKAFARLEFRVCVEEFMTDTSGIADLIFPAKDMFCQSDIIGSYWSPYVQLKPKLLDPPGEVIPESEIYRHLATRLGLKISYDDLPEPGNDNIENWLAGRIRGGGVTLNDLKKGPVLPPGLQQIAYEDFKFDTPSGKIELFSREAHEKWSVSPLPQYVPMQMDDQFPLRFLTPNAANRIHSQFGNIKIIMETTDSPAALISAEDARSRKISDGQRIRIRNMNGSVVTVARISGRIPAGIIVLYNGIWKNEGGGVNYLIEGRETDMGHGAAFHDNMVEAEPLSDE